MFHSPLQQNKVPLNRFHLRELIKRLDDKKGMVDFRSAQAQRPTPTQLLSPAHPHSLQGTLARLARALGATLSAFYAPCTAGCLCPIPGLAPLFTLLFIFHWLI